MSIDPPPSRAFMQQSLSKALEDLSADLARFSPSSAARMAEISQDIVSDRLAGLAHLDLTTVIDVELIETQVAHHLATSSWQALAGEVLISIRNILIFVPILWTWYHLSHATEQYARLIQQDPSLLEQSFLLLWQQGFQGTTSPFSTVALQVAGLVASIVVVTLLTHANRHLTERWVAQRARELAHCAESVLWMVQRHLSETKWRQAELTHHTFVRLTSHLEEMMRHLETERARIGEIAQTREQEFEDLMALQTGLGTSVRELVRYGKQVESFSRDLKGSIGALTKSVEHAERTYDGMRETIAQHAEASTAALRDVGASHSALEAAIHDLAEETTLQSDVQRALVLALTEIGRLAQVITTTESELRRTLDLARTRENGSTFLDRSH